MKKLFCFLLFACYISNVLSAEYDFSSNGFYYYINNDLSSVTLTKCDIYNGSVIIPDSVSHNGISYVVTDIGERILYNRQQITSIKLPSKLKTIGKDAFLLTQIKSIVLPETLLKIGNDAFHQCPLTQIIIPNSVTSIGDGAFYYCKDLVSASIGNGVKIIGKSAFADCEKLTNIIFGNSIETIDSRAFRHCYRLNIGNLPQSLKVINDNAFAYCYSYDYVTIPKSVEQIGIGVFWYSRPTSIIVEEDNPIYDSRDNCNSIIESSTNTLIASCDNSFIPNTVTSIGKGAFTGYSNTSLSIPSSVTNICDSAFLCTNINSIIIPNSVKAIGISAFYGSTKLTSLTIGNGVTEIGDNAFGYCTGLLSVTWNVKANIHFSSAPFKDSSSLRVFHFGEDVDTIPNSICRNLERLISVSIGCNVSSIGDAAFSGCSNLSSIEIPNSVRSIGHSAFWRCKSLSSLEIGNEVKTIGNYAFSGCSRLTSATIPDSVTKIGDYAFFDCSSLTSVSIGNSVTSIGHDAFCNCSRLNRVDINDLTSWCGIKFNNMQANPLLFAKNLYLNGNIISNLVIPNSITVIEPYAFINGSFNSIDIPRYVTKVGTQAFDGSTIKIIYWNAENCDPLDHYFNRRYEGGEEVIVVYSKVFGENNTINKIVFGDNVTTIPANICYGFKNLTSVNISESVKTIGNDAFSFCSTLYSIKIPEGVESIKDNAFNSSSLKKVFLPASIKTLHDHIFLGCDSLNSIYSFIISPNSINYIQGSGVSYNIFSWHSYNNGILYVPSGAINLYKNLWPWSSFNNIVEFDTEGIDDVIVDQNNELLNITSIYTIDGRYVNTKDTSTLPNGIYIINGKKYLIKH